MIVVLFYTMQCTEKIAKAHQNVLLKQKGAQSFPFT